VSAAYVGIGANLGDPRSQVLLAIDELGRMPSSRLSAQSSLYRTTPIGGAAQPDYINAVARIDTGLDPQALLAVLQQIELRHGRERSVPNAPRTLDLDLLLHGDARVDTSALTVPHPRMHERAFVLAPLLEIAPGAEIPGRGPAREWLARCADQSIERIA
jgi:2-amino-4-hydroxy-6-hydroxymethyldihydropteridine diphosphokinase